MYIRVPHLNGPDWAATAVAVRIGWLTMKESAAAAAAAALQLPSPAHVNHRHTCIALLKGYDPFLSVRIQTAKTRAWVKFSDGLFIPILLPP